MKRKSPLDPEFEDAVAWSARRAREGHNSSLPNASLVSDAAPLLAQAKPPLRYITIAEAAETLGLKENEVKNLILTGRLEARLLACQLPVPNSRNRVCMVVAHSVETFANQRRADTRSRPASQDNRLIPLIGPCGCLPCTHAGVD